MLNLALKLLNEINDKGYQAYIVGGFVRDFILGIESNDIDIATNATPREIKDIFKDSFLPNENYGAVTVIKWGIRFEITTFRSEVKYVNNRRPSEIKYIDNLYEDLLRRDFTINSICMDKDGKVIDLLNGREDISLKLIKTIGDANLKFEEDSLRILRAIRFATVLDFSLDQSVVDAIIKNKYLLKNLSYYRKKEELSKIFSSNNCDKGIKMLLDFGLSKELELDRLEDIVNVDNLIGIWSILNVVDKYPFTSSEKSLIKAVNEVIECNNLDPMTLYKYGLYVNSIAGEIKGIDKKKIVESYDSLVIHNRKDINVTSDDIMKVLNRGAGKYLKDIYDVLEHDILYKKIKNDREVILKFVKDKYDN